MKCQPLSKVARSFQKKSPRQRYHIKSSRIIYQAYSDHPGEVTILQQQASFEHRSQQQLKEERMFKPVEEYDAALLRRLELATKASTEKTTALEKAEVSTKQFPSAPVSVAGSSCLDDQENVFTKLLTIRPLRIPPEDLAEKAAMLDSNSEDPVPDLSPWPKCFGSYPESLSHDPANSLVPSRIASVNNLDSLSPTALDRVTVPSPGLINFLSNIEVLQRDRLEQQRQLVSPPNLRFLYFVPSSTETEAIEKESEDNKMQQNPSHSKRHPQQIDHTEDGSRQPQQASADKITKNNTSAMSSVYVPTLANAQAAFRRQKLLFNGPPPPVCPPVPHYPSPQSSQHVSPPEKPPFQNFIGGRDRIHERAEVLQQEQQCLNRGKNESMEESGIFMKQLSEGKKARKRELLAEWKARPSNGIEALPYPEREDDDDEVSLPTREKGKGMLGYLSALRSPTKSQTRINEQAETDKDNEVLDSITMSSTLAGLSRRAASLTASFDDLPSNLELPQIIKHKLESRKSSLSNIRISKRKTFKNGSISDVRRSQEAPALSRERD